MLLGLKLELWIYLTLGKLRLEGLGFNNFSLITSSDSLRIKFFFLIKLFCIIEYKFSLMNLCQYVSIKSISNYIKRKYLILIKLSTRYDFEEEIAMGKYCELQTIEL